MHLPRSPRCNQVAHQRNSQVINLLDNLRCSQHHNRQYNQALGHQFDQAASRLVFQHTRLRNLPLVLVDNHQTNLHVNQLLYHPHSPVSFHRLNLLSSQLDVRPGNLPQGHPCNPRCPRVASLLAALLLNQLPYLLKSLQASLLCNQVRLQHCSLWVVLQASLRCSRLSCLHVNLVRSPPNAQQISLPVFPADSHIQHQLTSQAVCPLPVLQHSHLANHREYRAPNQASNQVCSLP
jgi:hypothetical protein